MGLNDLINRPAMQPWVEGDNIPWNDPQFSRAMLKEHLSQEHDAASRRSEIIDRHVNFIHSRLLNGKPARILDLGCGPGLYIQRLCRLGHTCHGIDFSPASIEYARQSAQRENLACSFELADLRQAQYGSQYDLAMLLFGEFNVFKPADARLILQKAWAALQPGGMLLMEPSAENIIQQQAAEPATWYTSQGGLFSSRPHLVLYETAWDGEQNVRIMRYLVIETESGTLKRYSASYQAYTH